MNLKGRLFLLVLLILIATTTLQADDVDDWVNAQLQIRHVPGISIAVVKDGVLVKAEGYGVADLEPSSVRLA